MITHPISDTCLLTVDFNERGTSYTAAIPTINIVATTKKEYDAAYKFVTGLLGTDFENTMSPPNHSGVHKEWDAYFDAKTDMEEPYLYNHFHFKLKSPEGRVSGPFIRRRMKLAGFLGGMGIDLSALEDFS